MVEASHSLVIQITEEEIKEKACEIQEQVIGHDAGMADFIVKSEELHITLAMLQIEDAAEGIEMVKKIITDTADALKGAIIRIRGISTFSEDHVLYAKVVTLPSDILDRLSVIKKRVSQCSQKVQLIET